VSERIDFLPFDGWVRHTFDHPAPGPEWYLDLDAPFWAGPPRLTIAYVTRLFEDPCPVLAGYTDEQLNRGFWYLLSNGLSDYMCALADASVPLADRVRCVRSFVPVFENLLAVRCTPHLSHLDEPGAGPLNLAGYMWWDIIPFGVAPTDASGRELGEAALGAMADILTIDRVACQESAPRARALAAPLADRGRTDHRRVPRPQRERPRRAPRVRAERPGRVRAVGDAVRRRARPGSARGDGAGCR